jgi:N6-L-threonylcarbamoyladenine synthase
MHMKYSLAYLPRKATLRKAHKRFIFRPMRVLGIETSCDETAVAIVDGNRAVIAQRVLSQLEDHMPYGGVVPEIAARAHLDHLDGLIADVLNDAQLSIEEMDGIAATAGPGLIGGVMMGLMTAKALALGADKPLIAVNHLEAHALTARLTDDVAFPYALLLVSGGHCQILLVRGVGDYLLLGETIDDAVGEAFDKVAKMLGLPYPGGPELEKLLSQADASRAAKIDLPQPMVGRRNCDFSFAGLKTATRLQIGDTEWSTAQKADFSLAFHRTIAAILTDRLDHAFGDARLNGVDTLVVAGGVAANKFLCAELQKFCDGRNLRFIAPPLNLCTDNAAMIAWVGIEKLNQKDFKGDSLNFAARPRWPLMKEAA